MRITRTQSTASAVAPGTLAAVVAAVQAYLDNEARAVGLTGDTRGGDDSGDAGISAWRRSTMPEVFGNGSAFAARPRSWTGRW
ncbi:MAG: hypothetical protein OXI16_01010 [Chloroflexota bacterium]|nr:hypothetical protein [Chloroflexota bacterium]